MPCPVWKPSGLSVLSNVLFCFLLQIRSNECKSVCFIHSDKTQPSDHTLVKRSSSISSSSSSIGRWGSRGLRAAVAAAETRTQAAPNAAAQPQRPAGRRHGTPTRLGRPCAAVPPRPGGAAAQKRSQKRPQTRPYSSRSGTTGTDAGLVHSDGGRLASSRARHQYTS